MGNSVIIHVLAEDLLGSAGGEDGHSSAGSDVILIMTLKSCYPYKTVRPYNSGNFQPPDPRNRFQCRWIIKTNYPVYLMLQKLGESGSGGVKWSRVAWGRRDWTGQPGWDGNEGVGEGKTTSICCTSRGRKLTLFDVTICLFFFPTSLCTAASQNTIHTPGTKR
ncbi:hypothetical protein E2C01_016653 [Portunus trituberculatus]|uniref:Uncharacterized protein n=1 Tax=Portunus trituberculatus TaxID=210409 RepID=A0A5B7DRR3_PORTR|nr:hypothetical protein [Portunus trituberculatus]